jgi:hypothetical protein
VRLLAATVSPFVAASKRMIDLARIERGPLRTEPYRWAEIDDLFAPADAAALAREFPRDRFKRLADYGGEKDFEYEARPLIGMGADSVALAHGLSPAWQGLAQEFLSTSYRAAVSRLIGVDLAAAPLEVNVFHYPPGGSLGAHPDLRDKIVTHVLYFNETWNEADGGCLRILRSKDEADYVQQIAPRVGNSALLVRADHSWHAVSAVARGCRASRRSLTATFYHPGSISTMWPPGDATPLRPYTDNAWLRAWRRLLRRR